MNQEKEICCERQASLEQTDPFCVPERCCPVRIPQRQLPSPNSCMDQEELEHLERKIKEANRLLLDLGIRNPTIRETYLRIFEGVTGQYAKITLNDGTKRKRAGKVFIAGYDFVLLKKKKHEILVPYRMIQSVRVVGRFAEPMEGEHLHAIDSCDRRELTYQFGAKVAGAPELIQLFFKVPLNVYLLMLETKKVTITLVGNRLSGVICSVNREVVSINLQDDKTVEIPLQKIIYLKVHNKKKTQ